MFKDMEQLVIVVGGDKTRQNIDYGNDRQVQ